LKLSAASCGESLILIGTKPLFLLAYPAASRGECARSGFESVIVVKLAAGFDDGK